MSLKISLIIPAHNEAERLAAGYVRLAPTLDELDSNQTEVIVIDDGSTDETLRVAHEVYGHLPHARFVQQPQNLGKGAAVRLGIALAQGESIITADADMAINPEHFAAMVTSLRDANMSPGSRTIKGTIRYDSALRTWAGGAFNYLVRHYTGTTMRDTQCGCKAFQRGAARLLGLLGLIDGFAFDAEMFYLAQQLDLTVKPQPVTWTDVVGSSVRVGRDSLHMLRDLRQLPRTRYENPVVQLHPNISVQEVAEAAQSARVQGLVIARGPLDALVVLPRDGSLGGLGIAASLKGTLRVAQLNEFRGRTLDAV